MNAPLHSPKLTQRRAHPAVVNSTPAGERQRPRVRRGHEEKTRGGRATQPNKLVSNSDTAYHNLDTGVELGSSRSIRHLFVTARLDALRRLDSRRDRLHRERGATLSAAGKRR